MSRSTDWAGAYAAYQTGFNSITAFYEMGFQSFCYGKVPSLHTVYRHFRRIKKGKLAEEAGSDASIIGGAAAPATGAGVQIVRLTAEDVSAAENKLRPVQEAPRQCSVSAGYQTFAMKLPGGISCEFQTVNAEATALRMALALGRFS